MTNVTKLRAKPPVPELERPVHSVPADDLVAAGKRLRDMVPRARQGEWKRPMDRRDPLEILQASDEGRQTDLLPIRYGRMLQSPFTFYRGSAAVMAADLAGMPATGVHVQACGDCHLLNFGGFATPERSINFDINDFDETLPAPWEWDLKRLVASFVLAARSNGLSEAAGRDAALATARSYRERLRDVAEMSPLEAWYTKIGLEEMFSLTDDPQIRKRVQRRVDAAKDERSADIDFPKLAEMVGGQVQIKDQPPLIFHPEFSRAEGIREAVDKAFASYRDTLSDDRKALLDRYRLVDVAMKVVGIGSVGRYCSIGLLMSSSNQPLFLQFKEAVPSVLEPHIGKSAYGHAGQRVVQGQRLMQSSSDIFLGWATGLRGNDLYVRQLRDAKIKPLVETFDRKMLVLFGKACGWALARAHGRASHPWLIAGYLGRSEAFDEAMAAFAVSYADQTELDHALLKSAVAAGRIKVHLEEDR
ncbi:DUF2252 domain-containing protein [uncultured Reyranella sp.]|uniref:DUF2252 domain-containing protein n=1 Tax=uncultured Reyranella sp. TaxID=735512 RepID=UPI0025EF1D59|nr:DUF2252 domain-containing protein [uncultured Reyranella sp.]